MAYPAEKRDAEVIFGHDRHSPMRHRSKDRGRTTVPGLATARPTRAPYSSTGFPSVTQASKPPAMLLTFEYPIRCRVSAASAERAPLRQ